ncbi:dihydrofolate reductase family protein [Nonomuraea typhae]|uniref:dihydrofolate reductase family protein n=1 Tax=Nonomuraea typhae TaxID=2603600 RepID=UPI001CA5B7F5|nr:dihydrofolate reductase family protein [Nonomuraea typhae]
METTEDVENRHAVPSPERRTTQQTHKRKAPPAMRKLIVQQWVTLDNIAAEEDGGLGFVSVEPFSEKSDPAYKARVMGLIDAVDTLILGANTYAQSTGWASATEQGEYGEKLNNLTKFVASSTLEQAPWGAFAAATVTRDPAATIGELKRQIGKDIWLWGSLTLMRSLLQAGLVDEITLLVCPTARGKGTRLFEDRQDLKLIEATGFDNGVVILRYEITK